MVASMEFLSRNWIKNAEILHGKNAKIWNLYAIYARNATQRQMRQMQFGIYTPSSSCVLCTICIHPCILVHRSKFAYVLPDLNMFWFEKRECKMLIVARAHTYSSYVQNPMIIIRFYTGMSGILLNTARSFYFSFLCFFGASLLSTRRCTPLIYEAYIFLCS